MRENQLPVHVTLAKRAINSGSDKTMLSDDEISPVSNLDLESDDGTKVAWSLSFFNNEAAQNVTPTRRAEPPTDFSAAGSASAASASKLGTWLLASAVICVTTVYTICNPQWVPSCVAQTVRISKQLSAGIETSASTTLGGTAVTDTAKAGAGTVAEAADIDSDEIGTPENSRRRTHNGNQTGRSNAGDSGAGGGMLPALSPQSKPITNNTIMVPPPPPTPCVLPPAFGSFPMQPAEQDVAPQQSTADSGRTEATQSAALIVANQKLQAADQELQAADQELQAALRSSLGTVREWTR